MRKLGQVLAFHRDEDAMGAYGIRPPTQSIGMEWVGKDNRKKN